MKGVVVLDSEGSRLFAKYFGKLEGDLERQKKMELDLYSKTPKGNAYYGLNFLLLKIKGDVILSENYCGVVKSITDLLIYVIGDSNENELLLSEVLDAVTDSLDVLFGSQLEKRTLLENFDLLILTVDEIFEEG
jgi:coatomer subunit zeta